MRIGVMLRSLKQLGGIKVYTLNILDHLLKIDSKNEYVFFYNDESLLGLYAKHPNVQERIVKFPTKILWDQVGIPLAIRKEKIDLIFNPKLSIPLFTQAKTLFPLHGLEQFAVSEIFPVLDRWYFKLMMPLFVRRASRVISMTKMGVDEMVKYLGVRREKVAPIYESYHERFKVLPKESVEGLREKYHLPEKYLLFVGGLNPLKNFSNILRAFQLLKKDWPHKLVAVGFKRWKYEEDLALVSELGLQNDVLFTGFVPDEDLPGLYNLAEAFVFPSLYEGFGIPVLEAMACGCPVITTTTGCSREIAADAALLVNPREPREIAEAISKVLSDDPLKKTMIEKGLAQAKNFSWEKTARETLKLMEELVFNEAGKLGKKDVK
ncbi:MAG: glycosyltransferase family 4 protein [Chlamydiae bacterium]|nr:glycosyltransferase family 4 protein [Chlamydiota bacterium]MBI3266388.1 glycosyltransferase family 4 protein [Chlamydiota bacterium]